MKQKIERKIESIIDYISSKPESEITLDDYSILSSELRDIRFREQQFDNAKRMSEFMAHSFPTVPVTSTEPADANDGK